MMIELAIALTSAVAGMCCGWILYPAMNPTLHPPRSKTAAAPPGIAEIDNSPSQELNDSSPQPEDLQTESQQHETPQPETRSQTDDQQYLPATVPPALSGLPIGPQIEAAYGHFVTEATGPGANFVVALVRFDDQPAPPHASADLKKAIVSPQAWPEESLLRLSRLARIIRGIVRSNDRLGIFDATTMMIGMPQTDHETALSRADRIRMALAHNFSCTRPQDTPCSVSVALASTCTHAKIHEMLQVNSRQLRKAARQGGNQTIYSWQECFSGKVKN